eukprot:SAG11_NODE_37084_length_258_cov_0.981132_1_plen_20_part_10
MHAVKDDAFSFCALCDIVPS